MTIKKGDTVYILTGKDRGKISKVMKVFSRTNTVAVEGINMRVRHRRPRKERERGQRLSVEAPMDVSNVMLVCASCKKPTRTRRERKERIVARVCIKCGAVADSAAASPSSV